MQRLLLILALCAVALSGMAQKYWTQEGHIRFFSEAPLEDIAADNHEVSSIVDLETGQLVFQMRMTDFQFEKALMQEHFNEKYVESAIYPKSTFQGTVLNIDSFERTPGAVFEARIEGDLTIKGTTRPVTTTGTLTVQRRDAIRGECVFTIQLEDYGVKIPKLLVENIAEEVEIFVDLLYEPYTE